MDCNHFEAIDRLAKQLQKAYSVLQDPFFCIIVLKNPYEQFIILPFWGDFIMTQVSMINQMQTTLGLANIIRTLPELIALLKGHRDDLPCVAFHVHHSYLMPLIQDRI
jgi:hypothetical protein